MTQTINPEIYELARLGRNEEGLTITATTREGIREQLLTFFKQSKDKHMKAIEQEKIQTQLDEKFLQFQGWMKITDLQKDGNLYLLLVRTSDVDNPTEDEDFHRTIGFNTLDDTGEDVWITAGWSWTHDNFTNNETLEGVLYYQEIPPMFREKQNES